MRLRLFCLILGVCAVAVGNVSADPASGAFSSALTSFSLQEGEEMESEHMETTSFSLGGPSYLISSERLLGDQEILWPGFLTGMRSFTNMHERYAEPVGNPLYFETPFIQTDFSIHYIWHQFPSSGDLGSGELSTVFAQARVALMERLALIITKDGYADLNSEFMGDGSGWNDFAFGFKYLFIADEANDFALGGGIRWEWENGNRQVLQGDTQELNPFISIAKGWDRLHMLGTVNYRLPCDSNDANHIISWDVHFDYEVAPDVLPGFFPLLEVHGVHYLSSGDNPVSAGGLDITNTGGDTNVSCEVWGDIGFRWKLTPHWSFGAAYGFPITNPSEGVFNQRVTVDMRFTF